MTQVGDETMSVLEIWGAEYQENDCLLIKPESRPLLEAICARERCLMQVRAWRLGCCWLRKVLGWGWVGLGVSFVMCLCKEGIFKCLLSSQDFVAPVSSFSLR